MAQNNLAITLQQLDNNSIILTRRSENFSYTLPAVGMGEWRIGNLVDTSSHSISLVGLVPQVLQLLLKHTGSGSTTTITVVWTPYGGSSCTSIVLYPGDMIGFWSVNAATTSNGISALAMTASVANTPFELFIGG